MSQAIDIEAWRRDGERLWALIQANKLLVIYWNNPWRRLAVIGLILSVAALLAGTVARSFLGAGALALVSLPFVYNAAKYWRIGVQTGGLYSFFAEDGFGIGCDADRLSIPYSSIVLPKSVTPGTVNEDYIVLPVLGRTDGVRIERKVADDLAWDGKPYTRGIASLFLQDGQIRVRAYPNEMICHLFSAIYPLSVYLSGRELAKDSSSPPQSGAD